MKTLFPIVAAGLFLAGCQTTTAQNSLTQPFEGFGSETVSINVQHSKYKDFYKTIYRDLKVPSNFTFVNDWETFYQWHDNNVTGFFPSDSGKMTYYQYEEPNPAMRTDAKECVEDIKRLDTLKSTKGGGDLADMMGACRAMIAQQFMHNPEKNVNIYKDIWMHWLDNKTLYNANKIQSRLPTSGRVRSVDFAYATSYIVSSMSAHYAIWHRLYDFDKATHDAIDDMLTDFTTKYNYYTAYKRAGSNFAKLCNPTLNGALKTPTNDHCGSFNSIQSVGYIYYGLEFENQTVFDEGVKHLEILLAQFDKDAIYRSHAGRGTQALSYILPIAVQLDQLDYAFNKAFGINFSEVKNQHGVTPGQVYKKIYELAHNPKLLLPYYSPRKDHAVKGKPVFKKMIKDIESGKSSHTVTWAAFNLQTYFVQAPGLAKKYNPEKFKQYFQYKGRKSYEYGEMVVGFSNLTLRIANKEM